MIAAAAPSLPIHRAVAWCETAAALDVVPPGRKPSPVSVPGKTQRTAMPLVVLVRLRPTTTWPLLDLVSQPGAVSPGLTRQWQATRRDLATLLARDQLTG